LIDPCTGEVTFWTSDTRIDGHDPGEIDDLDLVAIDPLPTYVWYQDMVTFADRISDDLASQHLKGRSAARSGASRRESTSTTQR